MAEEIALRGHLRDHTNLDEEEVGIMVQSVRSNPTNY